MSKDKVFCEMDNKLRLDLVPPEVEESFAEVAAFGLKKLKDNGVQDPENNWLKGIPFSKHLTKARRHILYYRKGQTYDPESNLNHIKHAKWHLDAIITQTERGRTDLDDREYIEPLLKGSIKSSNQEIEDDIQGCHIGIIKNENKKCIYCQVNGKQSCQIHWRTL